MNLLATIRLLTQRHKHAFTYTQNYTNTYIDTYLYTNTHTRTHVYIFYMIGRTHPKDICRIYIYIFIFT